MQRGTLQPAMKIVAAGACRQEPRRFVLIKLISRKVLGPASLLWVALGFWVH